MFCSYKLTCALGGDVIKGDMKEICIQSFNLLNTSLRQLDINSENNLHCALNSIKHILNFS